jgi:hypothetical protein
MRHRVSHIARIVVPILLLAAVALAGEAGQRWMHP